MSITKSRYSNRNVQDRHLLKQAKFDSQQHVTKLRYHYVSCLMLTMLKAGCWMLGPSGQRLHFRMKSIAHYPLQ